ncbi:MAG: hypothetical protein K2N21_08575, partial [Rikenellaceae bacterium]|nr:hypothetical protein [Rikenellaceae bacterium]
MPNIPKTSPRLPLKKTCPPKEKTQRKHPTEEKLPRKPPPDQYIIHISQPTTLLSIGYYSEANK